VQDADALATQRRQQLVIEQRVLRLDQLRRARWIASSWTSTSMPSGPPARGAEFLALLEPGDADLEELVEVAARDAEELDALEQRQRVVAPCASTRQLNSRNESSRLM
jgi:hypothetical protein